MQNKVMDLKTLLIEQLRDRYDAAKQQQVAYPEMVVAATNSKLAELIQEDIDANQNHVLNLEKIFADLGESAQGEQCEGTQGLIHEANELLSYVNDPTILDIAIATSIQHINHHDIAGYRSCQIFAEKLNQPTIAQQLAVMLADERSTDKKLEVVMQELLA